MYFLKQSRYIFSDWKLSERKLTTSNTNTHTKRKQKRSRQPNPNLLIPFFSLSWKPFPKFICLSKNRLKFQLSSLRGFFLLLIKKWFGEMWKTYYTEYHNVVNGGWEPRVIILCPLHLAKNGRSKNKWRRCCGIQYWINIHSLSIFNL